MTIDTVTWTLLTTVFIRKDMGQGLTHLHKWQNILTKFPGVVGQRKKAAMPFEARSCLITD